MSHPGDEGRADPLRWTALILAGGEGTRARAIDPGMPKPLLPIRGIPAVVLQAQWLATRASRPPVEVIVLTGHQGERVAATLPRWIEHTPVRIVCTVPRSTVAALSCGLGIARTDRVLCLNCDTIVGCELHDLTSCWPRSPKAMTLLCSEHPDAPNRGEVVVDQSQLVRMQATGAHPQHPGPALANVGVYLFSRDRVARSLTDAPEDVSIERYLVNRLAASELVGVHSLGNVPVIDFGTPRGWQALRHADPTAFEILRAPKA